MTDKPKDATADPKPEIKVTSASTTTTSGSDDQQKKDPFHRPV